MLERKKIKNELYSIGLSWPMLYGFIRSKMLFDGGQRVTKFLWKCFNVNKRIEFGLSLFIHVRRIVGLLISIF